MTESHSEWMNLMDYAVERGVSLSTLRRYIRANKIVYRVENGRYYIPASLNLRTPYSKPAPSSIEPPEMEAMRRELKRAHEEIAELKTLIALYEESNSLRKHGQPEA